MSKKKPEKSKAQELADEINATLGDGTIRMASDPELQATFWRTGVLPIDTVLGGGLPRGRITEIYGNYCMVPETKVLTTDLRWVTLGSLVKGDGLVGFDEETNQGRGKAQTYQRSEVLSVGRALLPCYRIVTNRGEFIASVGHGIVSRNRTQKTREWRYVQDFKVGDSLIWLMNPWEDEVNKRTSGYLAGLFDGEGTLDGKRISFAQLPGEVLDIGIQYLKELGFEISTTTMRSSGVVQVRIIGGRSETMRFIGQVQPSRWTHDWWSGGTTAKKGPHVESGSSEAIVEMVEFVGQREVVTIGTSAKTYISEGFMSHNSTLKSYVGYRAIGETQSEGGVCGLIDTEHSFDPDWATELGVNVDDLIYLTPETGELAVDVTETLLRSGTDLIVWDSVAATLPQTEQKKRLHDEKQQPARLAALMSAALRKLTAANQQNTAMLFINQTREKVGVMYGSSETTPGGKALPFYATYRLALRKAGAVKRDVKQWDGDQMKTVKETHRQKIRATLEKSKLSAPNRDAYFVFDLETGRIDSVGYYISRMVELGFIKKKGRKWLAPGFGRSGEFNSKGDLYEFVEEHIDFPDYEMVLAACLDVKWEDDDER